MKAADQFRSADVTKWGITALVVWGVAVLGANLSGLVPPGMLAALHASRIEGATMNQLRAQVAALQDRPDLERVLAAGAEAGALAGLVSGSGPTIALLCASADDARRVQGECEERGLRALHVHSAVPGARIIS